MIRVRKRTKLRNGEVENRMRCRIAVLILCIIVLPGAAGAAGPRRPMVGFLPFHGASATYRYAIPHFVYWQLSHIPGIGRTDMDPMVSCIELDRLSVPKSLGDTCAYSGLALATGVEYLVTGEVEKQDASSVRFRVVVYSAANPGFCKEQVCECALSDLVDETVDAAKEIASDVGVAVDKDVTFDDQSISPKALQLLDKSIKLCTGCERDRSDVGESSRIAGQAMILCPSSQLLEQWARSYYVDAPRNLEGYRELRRRSMRNLAIRTYARGSSQQSGRARQWLAYDRNSSPVKIGADGKPILSTAWRNDLGYRFGRRNGAPTGVTDVYRVTLAELSARHPRSAYLQYCTGGYLARIGEWDGSLAACQAAAKINPKSYRLRMELARAYLGSYKNDKALEVLEPALRQWPKNTECHLLAAVLYRRSRQYDKAVDEMLTVRRFDPEAEGIHDLLAQDYMRTGKVVEAIRETAQADQSIRRGMIMFSAILSGIFVAVAMGIALLAHLALRPERHTSREDYR